MCAAKEKDAAHLPRPFLLCPKYFCGDALAGVALLHLGELLSSGVVVLEWASAPDGVRVSPDERREEPPKFACDEVVRLPERKARTPKGPQGAERALCGVQIRRVFVAARSTARL